MPVCGQIRQKNCVLDKKKLDSVIIYQAQIEEHEIFNARIYMEKCALHRVCVRVAVKVLRPQTCRTNTAAAVNSHKSHVTYLKSFL